MLPVVNLQKSVKKASLSKRIMSDLTVIVNLCLIQTISKLNWLENTENLPMLISMPKKKRENVLDEYRRWGR